MAYKKLHGENLMDVMLSIFPHYRFIILIKNPKISTLLKILIDKI